MLIEFSIENFRSIKEEVTLSMLSSKSDKILQNNTFSSSILKKDKLLKSAVIYGPNASGKTNIVLGLNFLKMLVINSHNHQKGNSITFTPFKFDKESVFKPTIFKIIFIKDEIKYIYNVSFTNEKIIEESLYYSKILGKKSVIKKIFERKETTNFTFGEDIDLQKFISERTLDNMLYLSKSTQEKYPLTSKVFDWFNETLQVITTTEHPGLTNFTINLANQDQKLKGVILKSLLEADFGIKDLLVSKKILKLEDLPSDFPNELKNLVVNQEHLEVKLIHNIANNDNLDTTLSFNEESEGTQRFFSLIGPWIDVLNKGLVLVIDELDTKLHHLLNVFLVNLFHDVSQNKNNAQLIFTTHNVQLLDQDLFRRDQIWFTEKNPNKGCTDLYSIIEFSPRKDKNLRNGYLLGRYGAIPFIKEGKLF